MSEGISPLQMAAAFAVFADGGWYHQYYAIEKIEDASGKSIWVNKPKTRRVLSDSANQVMDDILQSVVKYGTGTAARIALPSGGKTGTTSDSRDLWYLGYTRELCTAVWAGNSSGAIVTGWSTYGGSVSAPVWRDYMNSLFYNYVFQEKPAPVVEENPEEETTPDTTEEEEAPPAENEENETAPPSNRRLM
jgi:penicillin-binding protein 1A